MARDLTYVRLSRFADWRYPLSSDLIRCSDMETQLPPEDKLALLRSLDSRRKWSSLDDERVCVLCNRAITGRQIRLCRDGSAAWTAHCPTEECPSVPGDWFYHGNACAGAPTAPNRSGEMSFWAQ